VTAFPPEVMAIDVVVATLAQADEPLLQQSINRTTESNSCGKSILFFTGVSI
jgi:hypothetical protein